MNTSELSKKTVKIISQRINYDWIHPYKNSSIGQSVGSGFFIDNKGHILTCSHVIENSKKIYIEVPFLGEERKEVDIIGLCPELDLALLKTKNYKNTDFYNLHSEKEIYTMKPGKDVYAVGFPLGQDNLKFTKGIISGRQYSKIQTDTPINPGNSGGPLLYNNKVIGINASHIMFASNIGYAIPISHFYLIKELLFNKKNKLITRPFLGIDYQNSNDALLQMNTCKCESGILVKNVFNNSPISKTSIKQGDIICEINNISIDNFGLFNFNWFNQKMKFGDILKTIKNNEKVNIKYWRNKKLYNKNFTYSDYQLNICNKYPLYELDEIDYEIFGGLIIMELTNNHLELISGEVFSNIRSDNSLNNRYNNFLSYLDNSNKGEKKLIITHIFPNSYIKNLKIIYEYDIIKTVNNINTNTIKDFRNNIKKTKNINKDKFIEIETEVNSKIVISVKTILKEEINSSKTFKYTLSDTYNFFNKTKINKTKINKTKINKTKINKTKINKINSNKINKSILNTPKKLLNKIKKKTKKLINVMK